jgi:hypothetical protein
MLGNGYFSGSAVPVLSCKCGMRIRNCNTYLRIFQVCYYGNFWDPDPLPNRDPFFSMFVITLLYAQNKLVTVFEDIYVYHKC